MKAVLYSPSTSVPDTKTIFTTKLTVRVAVPQTHLSHTASAPEISPLRSGGESFWPISWGQPRCKPAEIRSCSPCERQWASARLAFGGCYQLWVQKESCTLAAGKSHNALACSCSPHRHKADGRALFVRWACKPSEVSVWCWSDLWCQWC